MKTVKIALGIVLVFVVGILLGSFGTQLYMHHHPPPPHPPRGPRPAEFLLDRLTKDLSLTDSQRKRVKEVLEQTDEKMHQHFLKVEPEARKIVDDGFEQVKKELTYEQKAKLDELKRRFERRR